MSILVAPNRELHNPFSLTSLDNVLRWYVSHNEKTSEPGPIGPYSTLELIEMCQTDQLTLSARIWRNGQSSWLPIHSVSEVHCRLLCVPKLDHACSTNIQITNDFVIPIHPLSLNIYCNKCGSIASIKSSSSSSTGNIPPVITESIRDSIGSIEGCFEVLPGFLFLGNSSSMKRTVLDQFEFNILFNCTSDIISIDSHTRVIQIPLGAVSTDKDSASRKKAMTSVSVKPGRYHLIGNRNRISPDDEAVIAESHKEDDEQVSDDVMSEYVEIMYQEIENERCKNYYGARILISCNTGFDRASFMMTTYLMRSRGLSLNESMDMIKRASKTRELKISEGRMRILLAMQEKYSLKPCHLCNSCQSSSLSSLAVCQPSAESVFELKLNLSMTNISTIANYVNLISLSFANQAAFIDEISSQLIQIFTSSPSIYHLDLGHCNVSTNCIEALTAITMNRDLVLSSIVLDDNYYMNETDVNEWLRACQRFNEERLRFISFNSCQIHFDSLYDINLHHISLAGNQLSRQDYQRMTETWNQVHKIDLSRNVICPDLLSTVLSISHQHLQHINMNTCQLNSLSFGTILGNKSLSQLNYLDASHNAIGNEGLTVIEELMKSQGNAQLKALKLSDCRIGSSGIVQFVKFLVRGVSVLKDLDISHNSLMNSGGVAIASLLSVNSSLSQLNVSFCQIEEEGMAAIVRSSNLDHLSADMQVNCRNVILEGNIVGKDHPVLPNLSLCKRIGIIK